MKATHNYMQVIKHALSILLLVSVLASCGNKANEAFVLDESNLVVIDKVSADSLIDRVSYIPLETNAHCLIAKIKRLVVYDSRVFVLNQIEDGEELLVFDLNGAFLQKVGVMGNGPKEYLAIAGFCINPYDKTIECFDQLKTKKHTYSLDGNYIRSTDIHSDCSVINTIQYIAENRLVIVNNINGFGVPLIVETDGDLNQIKVLYDTPYTFEGGYIYASNPMSAASSFILPLSTHIYILGNNGLEPMYDLSMFSTYQPVNEDIDGLAYDVIFWAAVKKGFSHLVSVVETSTTLLIDGSEYTIIFNKGSQQGIAFKSVEASKRVLPFSPKSLVAVYGKAFVGIVSRDDLANASDYYEKHEMVPNDDLQRLIATNDLELNPVLGLYDVKQP